jgi:hypothetical protein
MERKTLKEYCDLFNSNPAMQHAAVRGMESLSEWETAASYWNDLGCELDAAACMMLHDAITRGDCYRDETKHLHQWVDETVEQGIMSKEDAVKVIYPELNRIYKKYYEQT